jgi:hydrogenase maturation protease
MSWPRPIRVVAIGSPWGDDALAWEVLWQLRPWIGDRADIEMHAFAGGQRLLDVLDGQGTLLVIDAAVTADAPGTIHCFEWPEPRIEAMRPGSTHHVLPAVALRLADALGLLPPRVMVFGIEIEHLDLSQGLSPSVAAAVPALVRRIVNLVENPEMSRSGAAKPYETEANA